MTVEVETPRRPYTKRWSALAVILGAEAMDLLDASIATVSAPTIRHDLDLEPSSVQWVVAVYSLTMASGLITGGRLGDIFGRRPMFLTGVIGFVLASLLCSFAPSGELLIASRVLQGFFGAFMLPQGFGIIKGMFPPNEMVKALAMFGPVMGLSSVGGPILAGWLIDLDLFGLSWRSGFLITIAVGLLTFVAAIRLIPSDSAPCRVERPRLDVPGMLLAGVASLFIIFPLVESGETEWSSWMVVMLAAGIVLFVLFVLRVRKARFPLVEPSLFRNRTYIGGLLIAIMVFGVIAGFTFTLNLVAQLQLGYTPLDAGLAIAPVSVGVMFGSLGGFQIARRIGRRSIHLGLLLTIAGLALVLILLPEPGGNAWHLLPGVLTVGLGIGVIIAPLFNFVLASVDDHEVGSASGLLTAIQQLGSALGVAVIGSLFSTGSFSISTMGMVMALTVALCLVLMLPTRARQDSH